VSVCSRGEGGRRSERAIWREGEKKGGEIVAPKSLEERTVPVFGVARGGRRRVPARKRVEDSYISICLALALGGFLIWLAEKRKGAATSERFRGTGGGNEMRLWRILTPRKECCPYYREKRRRGGRGIFSVGKRVALIRMEKGRE